MLPFDTQDSLKFRKTVFNLFYNLIRVSFTCGMLSLTTFLLGINVPPVIVFFVFLFIGALGIYVVWHRQVVEVNGSVLEIKPGLWFIEKKSFSMEYIQEIKVQQSYLGKHFKYGDLIINAPSIDELIVIRDLDNVKVLSKTLKNYTGIQEDNSAVLTN